MRKTNPLMPLALLVALAASGCNGAGDQAATATWTEIMPGLSYVDSTLGDGPVVAPDDFIITHYAGYLWVDGKKGEQFDSSYERGEPIAFPLGVGMVIPGWEKGVPGMHVGGKRSLLIDPDMGYGAQGSPPRIPPNSTLMFDIEVLETPKVAVEITEEGTGPVAELGDNVSVHYTGRLWIDGAAGEQFDSSLDRGVPYRFVLGARQVIPGWDQGIRGLKVGTKARLVIPSVLGYGKRGAPPRIPADTDLVFDVELVEITDK